MSRESKICLLKLDDKIACYNYNDIYIINNLEKLNEGVTINIKQICYAFRFNG